MTHDELHDHVDLEIGRLLRETNRLRVDLDAAKQRIAALEGINTDIGRAQILTPEQLVQRLKRRRNGNSRWMITEPPVYFGDEIGVLGE